MTLLSAVEMCSWERHVLNFQIENYLLRNHETRKYLQEQAYRLQQGIVTSTTQQVRRCQSSPSDSSSSYSCWTDPFKSQGPRIFIVWFIPNGAVRTCFWKWQQMLSRVWGRLILMLNMHFSLLMILCLLRLSVRCILDLYTTIRNPGLQMIKVWG